MKVHPALLIFAAATVVQTVWTEASDAAGAAAHAAQPFPTEVSIPNTRRVDFVSKINGHRYSISVALPFEPAPARGYAVLYVLDGYGFFASATEIARGHANAPDGVVVVGIGYPDDLSFAEDVIVRRGPVGGDYADVPSIRVAPWLERNYDLTLPVRRQDLAAQTIPGSPQPRSTSVGGLDDFLKTIETEVKPRIAALAPIDTSNQILFGDSLGGLAALHALFVEPNAFRTFIVASPSIWWNHKAVLADEPKFAAAVNTGRARPHILVTMGSLESTLPRFPARWGMDPKALEAFVRQARMVENGAELVAFLKSLHGSSGYVVGDYTVFDQQTHAIAPWPALARGITFAFSTSP